MKSVEEGRFSVLIFFCLHFLHATLLAPLSLLSRRSSPSPSPDTSLRPFHASYQSFPEVQTGISPINPLYMLGFESISRHFGPFGLVPAAQYLCPVKSRNLVAPWSVLDSVFCATTIAISRSLLPSIRLLFSSSGGCRLRRVNEEVQTMSINFFKVSNPHER